MNPSSLVDASPDTLLISTKLKRPVPRKNYVIRHGLFEKLSQCNDMGVVFVGGGAGTGKTTLLSSFVQETSLKNACWVSLDGSNANVYSFWLYFTTAVSEQWEDGESFRTLMSSNPDASHMENLLIMLINRLCGEEDYYMVLDDVHCIKDEALIRTLEFFISAMPDNFHFFMLSREDPPVYLGPLVMSGRLLYIDGKQMQLTPQEGIAFLKNTLHMNENDDALSRLNTYADGWIGGLQLAAAVGAVGKDSSHLLQAGGGIAGEYMTREIFESLSRREKDFLVGTGFLSYFDYGICTALFDDFTKADFEKMLDGLVGKNLFVICVDETNRIYRYHNILSDYLSQQLGRLPHERKQELYIKAAIAFEQRGDKEEALGQYCAAEAYDDVLRVARSMEGRIEAWSYLDQVPVDCLIKDADLASQCFMYHLGNLNVERGRVLFEKFREYYRDSDIFRVMQFAEAYISQKGGILPQYCALTAQQIDCITLGPVAKAMILVENAMALMDLMEYKEAENCILSAIDISGGANAFVDFFAYNQMAQLYEETGHLGESLSCYEKSWKLLNSPSMQSGIGTNYYFGLTGVYMRRMEVEKAGETLEQARLLLKKQRIHVAVTDLTLAYHLAEMKFLMGDDDAGVAAVETILSRYSTFSVLTLGRLIHEMDCCDRLSPKLGELFLQELEAVKNYRGQPFMRLLRARILFKRGEVEEAFREADEMLTFSRLHENKIHLVEAGLLKIYFLTQRNESAGRQRETINILREAIHYAWEDRILMPFYLDRHTLLPLLVGLSTQTGRKIPLPTQEGAFLREVIAVCGYGIPAEKDLTLLSPREQEVLNQLALGITNREIGENLCISQATVKTHVLSIFAKLEVSSRMMAVQQGREKGLIE